MQRCVSFFAAQRDVCLPDWLFVTRRSPFTERSFEMPTDQYHEPPSELSAEIRTFARMITGLIEEAEAIGWYEQRISLEKDKQARAIMENAQKEEFKHFGMDLEFLLRKKEAFREILKGILFTEGNIVEAAEKAEKEAGD
jgi:hypothetical protein